MRRWAVIMLILLAATLLGGCFSYSLVPSGNSQHTAVNEREKPIPEAPTSDRNEDYVERAALYFISPDRQQLTPISRTLTIRYSDTLIENIVERLLGTSSSEGVRGIVPPGVKLLGVEESCSIVAVDLSIEAMNASNRDLAWMKAAITNSLIGVNGSKYVTVLINGREQSNMALPTGALTFSNESLQALWTRRTSEDERFLSDPASSPVSRDIVVYYPAITRDRLLPEVRRVTFNEKSIEKTVIDEIGKQPQSELCVSAFTEKTRPKSVDLITLDDGGRVVRLVFDSGVYQALEAESSDAWRLFASVTLTLCRNIPSLDGVVVMVGDEWVFDVVSRDKRAYFRDGIMRPDGFGDAVADVARLYFADQYGALTAVDRVLSSQNAKSPRAIIGEIIAGPLPGEDCVGLIPDGVTIDDVLGIRISDQAALINLSANFYALCQNMSFVQERNLVYSIVNTLCEMEGVNRVRFFINGGRCDTLADYTSIRTELMPNPGLVS